MSENLRYGNVGACVSAYTNFRINKIHEIQFKVSTL